MANGVQTQISRLSAAKSDIVDAITEKKVNVASGTKLDGLANYIRQIPLAQSACGRLNGNGATSLTITHDLGRTPIMAVISIPEIELDTNIFLQGTYEFAATEAEINAEEGFAADESGSTGGFLSSDESNTNSKEVQYVFALANYGMVCFKDETAAQTCFEMGAEKQISATTTTITFATDYIFASDKEYVYNIF